MRLTIKLLSFLLTVTTGTLAFFPQLAQAKSNQVVESQQPSLALSDNGGIEEVLADTLVCSMLGPTLGGILGKNDKENVLDPSQTTDKSDFSRGISISGVDIDALIAEAVDTTDTDGDTIPDETEPVLGTDPENADSDFDELNDYFELKNGLDPNNPDLNNDGLADYLEVANGDIIDVSWDLDADGTPNVRDDDNDNDGVTDGQDLSPFLRGEASGSYRFSITSSGNPAYVDFQVRPENPEHLSLPWQYRDWPADDKAVMQDIDNSKDDIELIPMLEIDSTHVPDEAVAEEYGIVITSDYRPLPSGETVHVGGLGYDNAGGGAAISDIDGNGTNDILLMGIDDVENNNYWYKIGWNADCTGLASAWSAKKTVAGPSTITAGGGAAIADIDRNGTPDFIFMCIDAPYGADEFRYVIGWNINSSGDAAGGWSTVKQVPGTGSENAGGGIAIADINGNGAPDMLLMAVDNPEGANEFRYRIGWDLSTSGNASRWSDYTGPKIGWETQGGGAAFFDFNRNGKQDLLLMAVDNPEGENSYRYAIGWDLGQDGKVTEWSSCVDTPAVGFNSSGGGVAVADINGNGHPDILLMSIDNPEGANEFRYRFDWDMAGKVYVPLAPVQENGRTTAFNGRMFYATGEVSEILLNAELVWMVRGTTDDVYLPVAQSFGSPDIGWENAGGDLAKGDIDGNGVPDIVFMAIDNAAGANTFQYRIGWNVQADKKPLRWSNTITSPEIGWDTQGGGVAVVDINRNGAPDILLMAIDNPAGGNNYWYMIGWDIDSVTGNPSGWSNTFKTAVEDDLSAGGGAAAADINGNEITDIILMDIDEADGTNNFNYKVGWDIGTNGVIASWSTVMSVPGIGSYTDGGGIEVLDIDNDGDLDFVIMGVDSPDGENQFRYRVGRNIGPGGAAGEWSDYIAIGGIGSETAGGGITIVDVDGGRPEMFLMGIDSAYGANEFRYRVGSNLNTNGICTGWTTGICIPGFSCENAGGGAAMGDIDGNGRQDIVVMGIDDATTGTGFNEFRYVTGWDIEPETRMPVAWSSTICVPGVGTETQGGGAALADINRNGALDIVLMGLDNPSGSNEFRYIVGWDVNPESGIPASWSEVVCGGKDAIGNESSGGGVSLADINRDGNLDIVLMAIDNADGENPFLYLIGWNLSTSTGQPAGWSDILSAEAVGHETAGGGLAIGDIDDNGEPDILFTSIDNPEGANQFRCRVGWNLDTNGIPEKWSVPSKTLNIGNDNGGSGAAIGDIDGNGSPDLFLMAIDETAGQNDFWFQVIDDIDADFGISQVTLAKYKEKFQLTGFSVEDNYGTDIGLFYGDDTETTVEGYITLRYEFLNSQNSLLLAPDKLAENNHSLDYLIRSYAHQDEAMQGVAGDLLEQALDTLPDGRKLPVLFAMEDVSAGVNMEKFSTGSVTVSATHFVIDLTVQDKIVTKSLKVSWYDTGTDELLDFEEIIDVVTGWGWAPEEEENTVKLLLVCDQGEIKITNIDSTVTSKDLPERNQVLLKLQGGCGILRFMAMMPALMNGAGFFVNAWRTPGVTLKTACRAASTFYSYIRGMKVTSQGITQVEKILGHTLNKGLFAKFGRAAKVLKVAGIIIGVGISFYAFFQIASQQGWTDFGVTLGAVYGGLLLFYFAAVALIALIPVVGAVLSILIIVSDLITALVTGSGWSDKAIGAIVEAMVDVYPLSEVNLEIKGVDVSEEDRDDNGLDVGDCITYKSRVVEIVSITRYGGSDDLDESFAIPSVTFGSSGYYTSGNYAYVLSRPFDDGHRREVVHEIGAWLETNQAMINLSVPMTFTVNTRVYYEEEILGSSDREQYSDTHTQSLSPLYFDILPNSLEEFLRWDVLTLTDNDGDGLSNSEESEEGTNPNLWDTDGDGLSDNYEIVYSETVPTNPDTDSDGLSDGYEVKRGCDPNTYDTDGDGLSDKVEDDGWDISFVYGSQVFSMKVTSSPLIGDTDGDGLSDAAEKNLLSYNPQSTDTNGDGLSDGAPVAGFGQAFRFDGLDDYIDVEASLNERPDWTFQAWVKPEAGNSGIIYSEGNPFVTFEIRVTDSLGIRVSSWHQDKPDNWKRFSTPDNVIIPGQWNLLAVRLQGGGINTGSLTVFVNDEVYNGSLQMESHPSTVYGVIGENSGALHGGTQASDPFCGEIDEVRIWNKALTPNEVVRSSMLQTSTLIWQMFGYWNFDFGNGTRAVEGYLDINHSNNGVVHGARTVISTVPVIRTTDCNVPVSGRFFGSRINTGDLYYDIVDEPVHGTVVYDTEDSLFTYTPEPGWHGTDSLSFRVSADGGDTWSGNTWPVTLVTRQSAPQPYRIYGETREVSGNILPDVQIFVDGVMSVTGNASGEYEVTVTTTGNHTVSAGRAGYRNHARTIEVTGQEESCTLDFIGNDGLIPNAPNLSYVLECINKWKYPPDELGLDIQTVLSVINAWKYPDE